MRLHVMSDLHTEGWRQSHEEEFFLEVDDLEPADALVLAGDIGNLSPGRWGAFKDIVSKFSDRYERVFYVPGNHEFWGTSIEKGWNKLRQIERSLTNFFVFRDGRPDWKQDGGLSFGGGTLWFPVPPDDLYGPGWLDYARIENGQQTIAREHLRFGAAEKFPAIMVSHHFPTKESVAREYINDPLNAFFCGDWDGKLAAARSKGAALPQLWIHGHTHAPMDFRSQYGFRVYCNPYGYIHEGVNPYFWHRVSIDTGTEA